MAVRSGRRDVENDHGRPIRAGGLAAVEFQKGVGTHEALLAKLKARELMAT